jgi:outer membrane protein OmpU
MNKMKKIGLSALAGTLASFAANAGEMTVTGSAELSYSQNDTDEITGNPLGTNKNISFAGSGELDNGWTVSVLHAMNDTMAGLTSSSMTLGMGGLGSISYDSGTGGYGLSAMDNVVPIAFEEADAGLASGMVDVGSVVPTKGSLFWKAPEVMAGLSLTVGWTPRAHAAHVADGGVSGEGAGEQAMEFSGSYSPEMVPGLTVGGGFGEQEEGGTTHGKDLEEQTFYAKYAFGPLSVGYQWSEEDDNGSTQYTTDVYGASFNMNDAFSISYQYGETEYDNVSTADVTAEFEGISAAYNVGPLAVKFYQNEGKSVGGTSGTNDTNRELNLSMTF